MNAMTIAGTAIRTDAAGRYCLNDLHRASGGQPGHRPGEWLRNKQAQELVAEMGGAGISAGPVATVNDGTNNGTFVAKELVYAYAMWISPAFHLKVIRAYDALVTAPAARDPMDLLNDPAAMRGLLLGYTEKVLALESTVAAQAPKVEFADAVMNADGTLLVREVAKTLGLRVRRTEKALRAKGVILSNNAPAAEYVTKGYFKEAVHRVETDTQGTLLKVSARVTGKGVEFIRRFAARHRHLFEDPRAAT